VVLRSSSTAGKAARMSSRADGRSTCDQDSMGMAWNVDAALTQLRDIGCRYQTRCKAATEKLRRGQGGRTSVW
jgi:hypothetical protein